MSTIEQEVETFLDNHQGWLTKAEAAAAKQDLLVLIERLRAVADRADVGAEQRFMDAFEGYLRVCRCGGMPRKLSDDLVLSVRQFLKLYGDEVFGVGANVRDDEHVRENKPYTSRI